MLDALRKPANIATAVRFALIPVLWVFAFLGQGMILGIGLIIAGLTDMLDGLLARRLGHVSTVGSKLDSIADHTLQLSAVVWIFMLMPDVFTENAWLAYSALGLNVLSLLLGIIKFKRIANLHLYLSKAAFLLFLVFVVHAFIFGQYNRTFLVITCGVLILASAETIVLQLARDRVDEHIGSILFLYLDEDHPLRRFAPKRQ